MSKFLPSNLHQYERAGRIIAGLSLVSLLAVFSLPIGIAAAAVGMVLVVTGAVGTCPIYTVLGLSTASKGAEEAS